MRFVISGGRDFADARKWPADVVKHHLWIMDQGLHQILMFRDGSIRSDVDVIYHGDCRGADKAADAWLKGKGFKVVPMPANWKVLGRDAGPVRNREMARRAGRGSGLISFWDGKSSGTKGMIREAKAAGFAEFHLFRY